MSHNYRFTPKYLKLREWYMGKFREYVICESKGLGELGLRLNQFVNDPKLADAINGAFLNSDYNNTGSKPVRDYLQGNQEDIDIIIPSLRKEGRITTLLLNKNPIYVRLSDGTEAHFSYEEWRRIEGKPALGKVMTIFLQRHVEDRSEHASKIEKVVVRD
jgi:hypothetical protein